MVKTGLAKLVAEDNLAFYENFTQEEFEDYCTYICNMDNFIKEDG